MTEEIVAVPEKQEAADVFLALMRQDIALLNKTERAEYLAALARSLGLNPMLRPFDIIKNDKGQEIVYSNISCATQLADLRKLDTETFYEGPLVGAPILDGGYVYIVKVRVREYLPENRVRTTEEVGCSWIDREASGQGLANLISKTHTKAKRRALLRHSGVGFPDAEELADIPSLGFHQKQEGPRLVEPSQPKALSAPLPQPQAVSVSAGPGKPVMRPPIPPPLPLKR